MNNKELAAELTKAYMQAYVSGIFADGTILQTKLRAINLENFTDAYKQFYDLVSSIPDEK